MSLPGWFPSISQHLLIAVLALLVYVLTTRVGRVRRPPTAAIAWVMALGVMPYVALPLFLMFGTRKLKAARGPRQVVAGPARDREAHWGEALLESLGVGPARTGSVRLHPDGGASREALWALIDEARHTIDVCTFILGDDPVGREALARLTRRAGQGVKVRLLLDSAGRWIKRPPSLEAFEAAGGRVAWFNPLLFTLRRRIPRNLRNHRKHAIADDALLWAGGRNIAEEYFDERRDDPAWIDLTFDLRGGVAAQAAAQFESDWRAARGAGRRDIAEPSGDAMADVPETQFVPSGPDQPEDTVHTLLLAACFHARRRLLAVTPYFVPDDDLLEALRIAVLRGVAVTLVIPRKSNHLVADFARGRALRFLAEAGADIRLVPCMVHAKAVVIDEELAWCGSANLDARSLLLNYESATVFYGATEIQWLGGWIEALAGKGERHAVKPVGLLRDLTEGLLLMIAFQV